MSKKKKLREAKQTMHAHNASLGMLSYLIILTTLIDSSDLKANDSTLYNSVSNTTKSTSLMVSQA